VSDPGGLIDTTVNPAQLPPGPSVGVARPAPKADTSDFWAHGVSIASRTISEKK